MIQITIHPARSGVPFHGQSLLKHLDEVRMLSAEPIRLHVPLPAIQRKAAVRFEREHVFRNKKIDEHAARMRARAARQRLKPSRQVALKGTG
jgi:hypothetical protein